MELDDGGWTLVWQHSYFEDLPLTTDMAYFSKYYRQCNKKASGWCNIPNKARFNPTEQMIVAYHKGTVVYAYASLFNRLIDSMWRGAILCEVDSRKIIDKITKGSMEYNQLQKMHMLLGLPLIRNHQHSMQCDTYCGSLTHLSDCRWEKYQLPSSISSQAKHVQMTLTMAIFLLNLANKTHADASLELC